MAGLNKEIWLAEIMEGFYGDDSFLSEVRDMSAFVANDKINLAEAGANPDVLVNNTKYPVPMAERTDTALALELKQYDTKGTIVRYAESVELAYDKMQSVVYGHRKALQMQCLEEAAYNYAPTKDAAHTPVVETSGDKEGTLKKCSFEDLLTLKRKFDSSELPGEGRCLVINPFHEQHLMQEDINLYKALFTMAGARQMFAGFKIYQLSESRMPFYNNSTGVKLPAGTAFSRTAGYSSIAFQKDEVMRADGTLKMFAELDTVGARGDLIGFQKRFLAKSIRGKGIGAIYSKAG